MVGRLIWSELAQQQKKDIFDYWNERNKSKIYSRKLNMLFNEAAEMLIVHPRIGRMTDFDNIRIKLVRDYWLVYQVAEDEVRVLAVWDTHRNPKRFENLLKTLK
ncbi:MAG: type II toxin-antitoxin system RelE/ParE family toxin [Bacteroidales bacterium]|nr:type II toxin-antitoxin system RelE/ParE family toxin [Bacteroidales bacterium]